MQIAIALRHLLFPVEKKYSQVRSQSPYLDGQSHRSTCYSAPSCALPPHLVQKRKREILANNQLDALFHVSIYFVSLHVSSVTALIIRRSNCITNTSSGMIILCKWLLGMPVRRELTWRTFSCIYLFIYLFRVSTCFQRHSAHHQEIELC